MLRISQQDSNSIILDSFAGSGTTAHAVLNMNKIDGGNRKFILVEMGNYADTITACLLYTSGNNMNGERLKKARKA